MTPEERLTGHIDQFNACVRAGHFDSYARLFTTDARMRLLGTADERAEGVHEGRQEIAAACQRWLGRDTLRIMTIIAVTDESSTFDYARGQSPKDLAGQIILRWRDGRASSMTVTMH